MRRTTNNKGNLKLLKTMELELSYFGMQNHNFPKKCSVSKVAYLTTITYMAEINKETKTKKKNRKICLETQSSKLNIRMEDLK